ncbi:MAG: hypothetical protein IPL83_01935 [Bdellovibrionales bacterium]|nr:hypothetical protein [Bdellovibrionales bacterium]
MGRQGGAQPVFVQSGGCGLAADVHEILHALGFWHEQSRTDRDTFVEILYENIVEEYKDQFDILPGVILGAYDFNSIMHYGVKFFSKNGKDTIRSRKGEKIKQIVPMSGLDASGVQELYRSELSSGGNECDPATKGGSCNIANGVGQMEGQTCNTTNQQWTGGVCRVKSCNSGFQPDTARAACVTSGSNNEAPRGIVDGFIGDGILAGWAYDPNDANVSIAIQYYIDGALAGDNIANKVRTDVNDIVKIPGNHGFEFRIPNSYRNGQAHTIKAFGIDLQGQTNPELGSKTFTLGTKLKPVSASFSTSGGRFKITVLNAGPRGETKVDGTFDWTRFLPEKWSTDGNHYYLDQPLSNYPSGATYVIRFRNPDVSGEAAITVRIP